MDLLEVLHLDELSHGLAKLSMFPYFDMAHYIVSVLALREQPGEFKDPLLQSFLTYLNSTPLQCMSYCCASKLSGSIKTLEPLWSLYCA